jgi:hypothetical protein
MRYAEVRGNVSPEGRQACCAERDRGPDGDLGRELMLLGGKGYMLIWKLTANRHDPAAVSGDRRLLR